MKRLGRVLGNLLAVALTVFSMQTLAETQLGGRDFNHMTTGFPLSGGHAAAACETCHMGGVFKGLPRTCDGCHQAGQRIVATPKSNSHIVTDAPCETCHFNTSTWLGARFNHGTARAGQCDTCHNGRISTGKPVNTAMGLHPVTTASCDQCHRASAWTPASWNHNGVTGDCSTCHRAAGPGHGFNAATHMSQATMSAMNIANCNVCHKNFYTFYGAFYDHTGSGGQLCDTCHNKPSYVGVKQMPSTAIHIPMTNVSCQNCHRSKVSFLGAVYDHAGASPLCGTCHANGAYTAVVQITSTGNHSIYAASGITNCESCHKSKTTFAGAAYDHTIGASACGTCHANPSYASAVLQKVSPKHAGYVTVGITDCHACHKSYTVGSFPSGRFDHSGPGASPACSGCHDGIKVVGKIAGHIATIDECSQCHFSTAAWLPALGGKPANHIPYNAGVRCSNCHTGLAKVNVTVLHTNSVATYTCANCHITPNAYTGNNQKTKSSHKGSSGSNCTTACHEHDKAVNYGGW